MSYVDDGSKFSKGNRVKVIEAEECYDELYQDEDDWNIIKQYVGKTGTVTGIDTDDEYNDDDINPFFYRIQFERGVGSINEMALVLAKPLIIEKENVYLQDQA